MANISLKDCVETEPGQLWNVMADGRIALQASSPREYQILCSRITLILVVEECIDLQYMKATANNPVGLYACAGLGNTGAADKGINWPLVNATAV
jgi:hypothetical protein